MLRKSSHIILAALLMISTMGMAVSKHYCGDDLVSVSMFDEAETCCGDMGCCRTENEFFQVKEDYSTPVVLTTPVLAEHLLKENFIATAEHQIFEFSYDESPHPLNIQTVLSLKQVYLL